MPPLVVWVGIQLSVHGQLRLVVVVAGKALAVMAVLAAVEAAH